MTTDGEAAEETMRLRVRLSEVVEALRPFAHRKGHPCSDPTCPNYRARSVVEEES